MIYQIYGTKCNKFLSQRATKKELKWDMGGLKGEIYGLKGNMDGLKWDLESLKVDMEGLNEGLIKLL